MRIKYSLIFSLIFFSSTAFAKNGRFFVPEKTNNHQLSASRNLNKSDNNRYLLIINPIESISVLNLQVHKTVHCIQAIFCASCDFSIGLKCYDFFSGSGHKQLSTVFPCHGVGGMVGMLLTGVFAHQHVNSGNTTGNGLIYGETHLFFIHLVALAAVSVFAFFGSIILLKVTDLISPLRVSEEDEIVELDLSQHGEAM